MAKAPVAHRRGGVKGITLLYLLLDYPKGPNFLPIVIAFFTAVMMGRRLIAWAVLYIFEALRAGASGFLVKDIEPVDLIRGIQAVARGDGLLSPGVTRRLIAEFATLTNKAEPIPDLATLTEREREVMALVAGGLNDEIAARLVISPATAKTHVSRAMVKLGARNRAQLFVFACESGLVRPR